MLHPPVRALLLALVFVCWSVMLGSFLAWVGLHPILAVALGATVASILITWLFDAMRPRG